jgi:hypothetical protein
MILVIDPRNPGGEEGICPDLGGILRRQFGEEVEAVSSRIAAMVIDHPSVGVLVVYVREPDKLLRAVLEESFRRGIPVIGFSVYVTEDYVGFKGEDGQRLPRQLFETAIEIPFEHELLEYLVEDALQKRA